MIIVTLVVVQNMAVGAVVEPPLEEVRYMAQVAGVLVEHLQTMVLMEGPGANIP